MTDPSDWIVDRPDAASSGDEHPPLLILAHGAGAGANAPFLARMAALLAGHGLMVARFNFAYMARAIAEGRRVAPPRARKLLDEYRQRVAHWRARGHRPVIGGKSMGGRVASMLADELFEKGDIRGLVCLGYPFHPPGRPQNLRIDHLETLRCPALICQGERDPFGTRVEVERLPLSAAISFCWLPDGDHDLKPRVRSGETWEGNLRVAARACAAFVHRLFQARETAQGA